MFFLGQFFSSWQVFFKVVKKKWLFLITEVFEKVLFKKKKSPILYSLPVGTPQ
jgi:hypothetical protein